MGNAWVSFSVTLLGLLLVVEQAPGGRADLSKDPPENARSVTIKNFEFAPPTVSIAAGGTVRWINADVANHQISTGVAEGNRSRPDGRVSSPLLFRGDEFSATFPTPGEYPYYCRVHPFMRATIVVKPRKP